MTYEVTIPDWSEGKPLTVENIEAENEEQAEQKVVELVNRLAGYEYCQKLPEGTKIRLQRI